MTQESRDRSGWEWFRYVMTERRPGRLSIGAWLMRWIVVIVASAASVGLLASLLGWGSWMRAALMAAAIGVTGACIERLATRT